MVKQTNKSKLSVTSRIQPYADEVENDKQEKRILDKQDQCLTTNVIGKETEPICDYLRCHHKFSEHGLRICQCKHPHNRASGAYFLLHHN
jgi:hypothetical protein